MGGSGPSTSSLQLHLAELAAINLVSSSSHIKLTLYLHAQVPKIMYHPLHWLNP